jgi:iron complex outermembrane recepter protein
MSITLRTVLMLGVAAPLLTSPVIAQDAIPAVDTAGAEQIIVTGTRRTDRTVADSPVPVDVIGGAALTNQGFTETNKILNQLVPSFNFPQPSIADGTDVIRPATLRGLGPDQTLVLVNGKRRHVSALLNVNGSVGRGTSAVDMNLIPTLAIERIEVLRDGASSQYGSDAIAGVINVQLKKSSNGGKATASFGKYITSLDGVINFTGITNNGGQPVLDPNDTRILQGVADGERKARDGETYTFAANIGVPIGPGFVNITGEYRNRGATNRAGFDLRPNYIRPTAAFDPRELTFNRLNFKYGDAKTTDYNFFLNAGLPIGEIFEVYAFGSYGKRDGLSAGNYRQASSANNRDFSVLTQTTVPTAANFVALRPDGFLPLIDTKLQDYAGTVGIKGEVASWNLDVSLGRGHNKFDYGVTNSLNTSFGPQSQSSFDSGGLAFGQWLGNVDISREFDAGLAGPLSIAFGAEYRDENFKIRPGDLQSYAAGPLFKAAVASTAANCVTLNGVFVTASGLCTFPGRQALVGAQVFPGFPPAALTDASRNSYAGYLEFDAKVTDSFTLTAAGRYEKFSDFGSTVNGKVAARYELTEGFALRGAVSNGFRAPSLHQQFFTTTSTNFINGQPVDISTLAVGSPVARALGAKPLKAEKSVNYSFGLTMRPVSPLTVTVDFYKIDIKDRIVLTENLGAAGTGSAAIRTAVKNILDANGFQSVGAARFFINGLDTSTQGLDIIATYTVNTDSMGKLALTAGYNLNDTKITKRKNDLGALAAIPGIVLFGRVEGLRISDGQPKTKLNLSADWQYNKFGATFRSTRYGAVLSPGSADPIADPASLVLQGPDDLNLSPKWVSDLEVRYDVASFLQVAVGANNVFDIYPDRLPTGNRVGTSGQYPANFNYLPYSNFSPFGFNGRYLYARATASF